MYGSGGDPGFNDNSWNNYPSMLEDVPLVDVVPVEFQLLLPQGVIGLRKGANVLEVSLVDNRANGEGERRPMAPITLAEVRP